MNVWRLIAHHKSPDDALERMKASNRIVVGWPDIGDLRSLPPRDASDIAHRIRASYPTLENAQLGGPSLWNLWNAQVGDSVIVSNTTRRLCVFEIIGQYFFARDNEGIFGYHHACAAVLTEIDPERLWESTGKHLLEGQNIRWTLAACALSDRGPEALLREGARFSVQSTAIERNPIARRKCIENHGLQCAACGFDFGVTYGDLGRGYIHVHHLKPLASSEGIRDVNPVRDLVPLCPNCHAMVHRQSSPIPIEDLMQILSRN